MSKFLDSGFEAAVEVIDISHASIDGTAIADFLKNTPRLRILTYSHKAGGNVGFQDWDLCQFIMAIENEVGSHLEELSICIGELHGSIIPGASVSKLTLVSHGKSQHEKALDALFCDLAAKKDNQVPALEKIYLSCPRDADSLYKEQCEKLAAETEKAGVLLHLKS